MRWPPAQPANRDRTAGAGKRRALIRILAGKTANDHGLAAEEVGECFDFAVEMDPDSAVDSFRQRLEDVTTGGADARKRGFARALESLALMEGQLQAAQGAG